MSPSKYDFTTDSGVRVVVGVGDPLRHMAGVLMCRNDGVLSYADGLAWRVVDEGGNIIRDETDVYIANYGEIKEGECVVSGGGRLGYKNIVHAVVGGKVEKAVENTLKLTEKLKGKTLLVPLEGEELPVVLEVIRKFYEGKKECFLTSLEIVLKNEPPPPVHRLEYSEDDITAATPVKNSTGCVLLHFVSPSPWTPRGCMGKITKTFGKGPSSQFSHTSPAPLGTVKICKAKKGVYIYSAVVLQPNTSGGPPTVAPDQLHKALTFAAKTAYEHGCSVHIYRPPDAALPSLDWPKAHKLIAGVFKGVPTRVHSPVKQDFVKYSGVKRGRCESEDEESEECKKAKH